MTPDFPNENETPDTDRPVPPYEGRRESAEVDPPEKSTREGARTAGATGPVEDSEPKGGEDMPQAEND